MTERWPPVYDADELAAAIQSLVDGFGDFYDPLMRGPAVCQGDIIRLETQIPLLSADGDPIAEEEIEFWLVIGNTCDFERDRQLVKWTQLAPIFDLGSDLNEQQLRSVQLYQTSRAFYVPSWRNDLPGSCYVTDLLRPVSAEKGVFDEAARVEARLSREGWVLLHSCLVRFLCRDDGRFD